MFVLFLCQCGPLFKKTTPTKKDKFVFRAPSGHLGSFSGQNVTKLVRQKQCRTIYENLRIRQSHPIQHTKTTLNQLFMLKGIPESFGVVSGDAWGMLQGCIGVLLVVSLYRSPKCPIKVWDPTSGGPYIVELWGPTSSKL